MTNKEAGELLEAAAARLGEHFGSVQIMASWTEHGETKCVKRGCGDWYSRQGMAHEFINQDVAQENAYQIADKLKDKPDGSDDWKQEAK